MNIEIFKSILLEIPLWQMSLYAGLLTILMLFGYSRLGMTISLGFLLYWGFIYNRPKFTQFFGSSTLFMGIYLICGLALVFLILISFFIEE